MKLKSEVQFGEERYRFGQRKKGQGPQRPGQGTGFSQEDVVRIAYLLMWRRSLHA